MHKALKPGVKISEVYKACSQYGFDKSKNMGSSNTEAGKKFLNFARSLPKILGFGIGFNFKEEFLTIKEDNENVVSVGMSFNIRLSLTNFAQPTKEEPNVPA